MKREAVMARMEEIGLVPVVRASSPELALQVAEIIEAGGIPVAEITMTVPGAVEVIREVSRTRGPRVLVGGGTVLDARAAIQCIDAGAEFIVSPAFDPATVAVVREAGKVVVPGALTPTEVVSALNAGADFIKIFPCGNVGGAKYISALRAPFPNLKLIPTGGVNLQTAGDFIRAGAVALGVGADLVDIELLQQGKADELRDRAQAYAQIIRSARDEMRKSISTKQA